MEVVVINRLFARILAVVSVLLIYSFSMSTIALAGDIVTQKPLRVVMDNNYPPFTFYDDKGNLQGILVDQWALWSKKTGRPVELVGMDWSQAMIEMEAGHFDVIDTIFKNPQREMIYDFTKPYATLSVPIFFSNSISGISGIKSLKGFTVAAKSGDNAIDVLKTNGIESVVEYSSYEAIIKAALNKEILVFVADEPPARYFMAKYGITEQFNKTESLYSGQFCRAVAKGNAALVKELDAGFDQITNGDSQEIERKWYGASLISKRTYKWLIVSLFIIGGVVALLIFLNWTLRHQIADKTRDLARLLEEVRRSEGRNRAILAAVPDMIFVLDKNGCFLDYQAAQNEALYVTPDMFIGKTIRDLFPQETAHRMMGALSQLVKTGETQVVEYQLMIDNELKDYEARMLPGEDGRILAIVRDVSEQKSKERQIYRMSIEDQLTGVYNRNHFESELLQYQNRERQSVGVILCDLDGLKLVNDTLGHDPGDQCLKATASILKKQVGDLGSVSRIGGDEFGVLMPNGNQEDIDAVQDKILQAIQEYNESHNSFPISLSFGASVAKGTFSGIHESVKEADAKMYREKLTHKQNSRGEFLKIVKKMLLDRESDFLEHAEHVKKLSVKLGTRLGIQGESLKDLELLAEFHDVGKIAVVDGTLQKSELPSELEWLELKRHTEIGFRIADATPDLRQIGEYILKHHEWWDGSGYPLGLKGEEIPLICRILAVTDAYDTMTRNRPYRKALSHEEAVEELRRNVGKQFDPEVTREFIAQLKSEHHE